MASRYNFLALCGRLELLDGCLGLQFTVCVCVSVGEIVCMGVCRHKCTHLYRNRRRMLSDPLYLTLSFSLKPELSRGQQVPVTLLSLAIRDSTGAVDKHGHPLLCVRVPGSQPWSSCLSSKHPCPESHLSCISISLLKNYGEAGRL